MGPNVCLQTRTEATNTARHKAFDTATPRQLATSHAVSSNHLVPSGLVSDLHAATSVPAALQPTKWHQCRWS